MPEEHGSEVGAADHTGQPPSFVHYRQQGLALTGQADVCALARGETHPALLRGAAEPGKPPEVVFMYTGQGSQYLEMSRQLYDSSPVYREVIDQCDALLGADAQGRTLNVVLRTAAGGAIHETAWTQPALFAVEYALTQLWRAWGIEPAAVIGHSVGEYVAACVVTLLYGGLCVLALLSIGIFLAPVALCLVVACATARIPEVPRVAAA